MTRKTTRNVRQVLKNLSENLVFFLIFKSQNGAQNFKNLNYQSLSRLIIQ